MSDYLLQQYLPAFASTLAIELGVAVLLGFWNPRQLGAVALVNIITHPTLHVVLWTSGLWHTPVLLALEVVVFVAEGALLMRLSRLPAAKALGMSAAMNAASALLGLVLVP
ncbi:MAG: hypothetical protein EHM24_30065 [Acidobacteria bacterium]|nr:MAG: hypothetical protein EHM24_30065 [Acidobacteriota bacterium]